MIVEWMIKRRTALVCELRVFAFQIHAGQKQSGIGGDGLTGATLVAGSRVVQHDDSRII